MQGNSPEFGTQLIGQTEKTLNAILGRLLARTGLTEPQWVTLTIAVMNGGTIEPDHYAARVAELHTGIRTKVGQITQRLWGDLPADELATAARVLATVLERASAELADERNFDVA
jgi:hypothetical protein